MRRFREIKEVRENKTERSLPVFPDEIVMDDGLHDLPSEISYEDACSYWDEFFSKEIESD